MRIALDTNILVYAEGVNDPARRDRVVTLLRKLPSGNTYVPLQALAELFHVLVRKAGSPPSQAQSAILEWRDRYPVIETSQATLLSALELATRHGFRIWDAIIFSAASLSACRILLSEDLQDGFTWNGVTVVNPFLDAPNELLADALNQ